MFVTKKNHSWLRNSRRKKKRPSVRRKRRAPSPWMNSSSPTVDASKNLRIVAEAAAVVVVEHVADVVALPRPLLLLRLSTLPLKKLLLPMLPLVVDAVDVAAEVLLAVALMASPVVVVVAVDVAVAVLLAATESHAVAVVAAAAVVALLALMARVAVAALTESPVAVAAGVLVPAVDAALLAVHVAAPAAMRPSRF